MSDVAIGIPSDLSIPLTTFALTFDPKGAIADSAAPKLPVNLMFGKYPKWDKKSLFSLGSTVSGLRGQVDEIQEILESGSFNCKPFARQVVTPRDSQQEYAALGIDKAQRDAKKIMHALAAERESRVHSLLTTAANYSGNTAGPLAGTWDLAASTPLQDGARALRSLIGRGARTIMVMGRAVFDVLKFNAQVLSALGRPGGQTDREISQASREDIARMFEVDEVLVSDLQYNTANDGQTMVRDFIWSAKHVAVMVCPRAEDLMGDALSFALTFRYTHAELSEIDFGGIPATAIMRRWFDESEGAYGSWRTIGAYSEDIQVVAPDAGFLITNVIP
jgi:hypothetical protein